MQSRPLLSGLGVQCPFQGQKSTRQPRMVWRRPPSATFTYSRLAFSNVPLHYLTHPQDSLQKHTYRHYTQPICSPVDLQIVFSAKSNWRLSKALLSIFPVSFCFIVLSRYFPWWLACCRWKRENCVWIMNSHLPPFSLPNTLEAPAVVYPWSLTYININRLKDDV